MCSCRQVTWGQVIIQVWDCDDSLSLHSLSLHDFSQRIGSKQVKDGLKWRRKTKEWGKIAKCDEIRVSENLGEKGSSE